MKPTGNRDPRVDRYIDEAAEWGFPNFTYRGIVCSMAAFKAHCAFGFWKEALILPQEERPRNRPWARSVRRRGAGTPAPGMEPAAERAKETNERLRLRGWAISLAERPKLTSLDATSKRLGDRARYSQ
jgi:hypothetical protein